MNRPLLLPHPLALVAAFAGVCTCTCLGFPKSETSATTEANVSDETGDKDHVVFLGANVFVLEPQRTSRIRRVARSGVELVADGVTRIAPLAERRNYHVTLEPKVSRFSVTVSQLNELPGYSPGRDPQLELLRQQMELDSIRDERHDATTQALAAVSRAQDAMEGQLPGDPALAAAMQQERQRQLDEASSNLARTENIARSLDGLNPVADGVRDSAIPYDALDVSFTLSSPVRLDDAYVVVVSRLRLPSTPVAFVHAIKVEPLPVLTTKPRTIRVSHSGLPLGFEVERSEVHVYSGDREIATNRSARRVEVTGAEALQFLLAQYQLDHRDGNHPPRVMTEFLPVREPGLLTPDLLERNIHVRVNREGRVVDVQLYPEGVQATDRFLEELARDARFYPALSMGDPVDGEITLSVASLVR